MILRGGQGAIEVSLMGECRGREIRNRFLLSLRSSRRRNENGRPWGVAIAADRKIRAETN